MSSGELSARFVDLGIRAVEIPSSGSRRARTQRLTVRVYTRQAAVLAFEMLKSETQTRPRRRPRRGCPSHWHSESDPLFVECCWGSVGLLQPSIAVAKPAWERAGRTGVCEGCLLALAMSTLASLALHHHDDACRRWSVKVTNEADKRREGIVRGLEGKGEVRRGPIALNVQPPPSEDQAVMRRIYERVRSSRDNPGKAQMMLDRA